MPNVKTKLPYDAAQRAFVEQSRRETLADLGNRSIPLGLGPQILKPEIGPTASTYYAAKFKRGEIGNFWFHHVLHFKRGLDHRI
jgi:hypothetical protein